jgi:ribosomal protein S18 acetylase RimI-like enzyme
MGDAGWFTVSRYDGDSALEQLDLVRELYAEVYAEPPYREGPEDVAAFADDWRRRVGQPGFRLVVAHVGSRPAGFAFGHQLTAGTRWWAGAVEPLPSETTTERPGRTFAVIEIALRREFRRRGIARVLHATLLAGRTEERVTLLVRPEAEPARRLYAALGYRRLSALRPGPDTPRYDVLVLPLAAPQVP